MRGAVLWETGRPLTLEEFRMPRPKAGELLIKTKACKVCHSDLHVLKVELPFSSPCVLGHEVAGEVVDHGMHTPAEIINRFPVGSHVVGTFIMPCGNCFYCVKGQEDLCESFFAYNHAKGTLYDGETRLFLRSNGNLSIFVSHHSSIAVSQYNYVLPETGVHAQHGRACRVMCGASQRTSSSP